LEGGGQNDCNLLLHLTTKRVLQILGGAISRLPSLRVYMKVDYPDVKSLRQS